MTSFNTITFEITENVAVITLNRPDAANGLSMEMSKELLAAALSCKHNGNVRAVLINANGKMFCAGGDLKEFSSYGDNIAERIEELLVYLNSALTIFAKLDAPVIAAVNGMAAGAGFSIACSADLVFAAESAKFTMAYTAAGLSPDGSASYYLPRIIGMRKTQDLMLTNRRLSAEEAKDWGIINNVVADEKLQEEALAQAKAIANGPTKAFGSVKKLLHESYGNNLIEQLQLESDLMSAMSNTADGKEGIDAFVSKRAPSYKGC